MQTNRYIRGAGSLMLLLVLVATAASSQARAVGRNDQVGSGYCQSVSTRASALQDKINDKLSVLSNTWKDQNQKLTMLDSSQASKVSDIRGGIDAERAKNIADLRTKARTAAERQVVDAYASSVAQAVEARRQAVDEARTAFGSGLKTIIAQRQATLSGQVQALKLGVADAYATAQNSCTDKVAPTVVRTNLLQALSAAREHYQSERTDDQSVGRQIQQLVADRQAAVKAANDSFRATAAAARQTLKAAFGSDAATI